MKSQLTKDAAVGPAAVEHLKTYISEILDAIHEGQGLPSQITWGSAKLLLWDEIQNVFLDYLRCESTEGFDYFDDLAYLRIAGKGPVHVLLEAIQQAAGATGWFILTLRCLGPHKEDDEAVFYVTFLPEKETAVAANLLKELVEKGLTTRDFSIGCHRY